jgi:hypothetical protein
MAGVHGKKTVFKLDNAAGTLTDISALLNDVQFPRTKEKAQDSGFGQNSHTYVVGLQDGTITISGPWSTTIDAQLGALMVPGQDQTLTFEYGPQGGSTGNVKYTGEAYLESYEPGGSISDVSQFSATLQISGDVSRTTFA